MVAFADKSLNGLDGKLSVSTIYKGDLVVNQIANIDPESIRDSTIVKIQVKSMPKIEAPQMINLMFPSKEGTADPLVVSAQLLAVESPTIR
ncbi:MAG: hypothetical protein LAO76_13440 [Acidobacteriia bacterium]|nr:hypothetical protein [Terriglobia bacterium]